MAYRQSALMQERLAGNRARIIRATRKLVARGGFRAAPIAAIAAGAGLSTGAIYRHFPSKAALFIEVLTAAVAHEIEILRRIGAAPGPARLRLKQAVESFARRALEGRYLAYAFIAEPIDAEVDSARIRCRRQFSEVFELLVREGIHSGEFAQQDAAVAAACIVGAFIEALVGPIAPGGEALRARGGQRLITAISGFCLRAVLPPELG